MHSTYPPYPIEVNGLTRIEPSPFHLANAQGLAYANVETREGSNGSARTLLLFINGNERKYVLRNMDKDILREGKREERRGWRKHKQSLKTLDFELQLDCTDGNLI